MHSVSIFHIPQFHIIQCAKCAYAQDICTQPTTLDAPPQGKRENCHGAKVYKLKQRRLKKVTSFLR